jgi:hypothetical protein
MTVHIKLGGTREQNLFSAIQREDHDAFYMGQFAGLPNSCELTHLWHYLEQILLLIIMPEFEDSEYK